MQRVQKFLADLGFGSRRTIEEWINAKRLQINGKITQLGLKVNGKEEFKLDNKILRINRYVNKFSDDCFKLNSDIKIIIYNKPPGKICTRSDPKDRPTVFEDLPKLNLNRWVAVGRLDLNTSGLLLFTNSGELAHKLMHPSYNQEREYMVRVFGNLTKQEISSLKKGINLSDGMAKFKDIVFINQKNSNSWYKVVLTEGKNREIKRLFESKNLTVNRLIRIRFGNILLPKNLRTGQYQYLDYEKYFSNTFQQ